MRGAPFLNFVLAVALTLMVGWLLIIGRGILLPLFTAVITVYVISAASDWLARMPIVRHLPPLLRHILLLLGFSAVFVGLGLMVATTVSDLLAAIPRYQANLETMLLRISAQWNLTLPETLEDIRKATIGPIRLQSLMVRLLGGLTSFGLLAFLVIVYAGFMIAERNGFDAKLVAAFPQAEQARTTDRIIREINRKIGEYLAIKTLINIILGIISFAILWAMGVDFALFWAVVIALSNYVPYVGSIIGVLCPVVLSLAQFNNLWTTSVLALLLIGAQTYVGNVLEPKMIGKQLNLSPLVVLISLSVWAAMWGLPGAILAIPMTSILVIMFVSFDSTRFIAILLSDDATRTGR